MIQNDLQFQDSWVMFKQEQHQNTGGGSTPPPPAPPLPPAKNQAAATVAEKMKSSRKKVGVMQTILTSGLGAPSSGAEQRKTLLGS